MDEREKKTFDLATELAKQLITLATGTIALTITFSKDFLHETSTHAKPWALVAWSALLISVVFGIWTIMALTGNLGRGPKDANVYTVNVRIPAGLQILSFLVGLVLTVVFAAKAI
jgi:hypothetical protein